ncbi:hypothetical protein P175DRAFT_0499278 [Aspergillus ochraceoroseus IBT 24754]|uniref:Nuclear RNA binding protein n=1 Tax=Aspergillus ochraceoroseus IBT 24754 TaxID=1392256 RepID=A0A2T5M2H0_9EURO|nr:uncharacterized protein P175DRAFT_0499278 [Aspergillus ochraceoroseus IBT 24754]PTU22732.1 hypothetical protein P175DRAFT_0499278 [Aspergillus ochraceoroseus IBT 24754]
MSPDVVGVDVNGDRDVDIDPHEADRQLQRSLELSCSSPDPTSYSRKHGRPSRITRSLSVESDFFSEVSGQFDDAEEAHSPLPPPTPITGASANASPSSYSVKRRRSNDWPNQQPPANDEAPSRRETIAYRQLWPFQHHGKPSGSAHGSPRSPRPGRSGRRSRFVEGHMNDTVSEKPPSIFLRDGTMAGIQNETARSSSRQSGIFRFGKAIASAFHPFAGSWSNMSEIWKGPQEGHRGQETANDPLSQAERAYEELKRSGYKGTVKGRYMQSLQAAEAGLPDQTWKSIQEKMEYSSSSSRGGGGQHSRQHSGYGPSNESVTGSSSSLRPSFPDLRKAKSSLGIPSMKRADGTSSVRQHVDGEDQEVRHQKSRKDMQRQAKLLKRVSDLQDKLDRAQRELRELTGDDELLMRSLQGDKFYPKRFVPGALPSLPSERLLNDRAPTPECTTPLNPPLPEGAITTQEIAVKVRERADANDGRPRNVTPRRSNSNPGLLRADSRSRTPHSPSRKRKSPDPESRKPAPSDEQQQSSNPSRSETLAPPTRPPPPIPPSTEAAATTPSRKAKLPKTARGDSPGSVERKQKSRPSPAASENGRAPGEERASRPLRSANLRNRSVTPVLRMKKGRGDLRSASHIHEPDENKENQHHQDDMDETGQMLDQHTNQQEDPEADQNHPTPTPRSRRARYEYIPPVPPLPKDLAATAAKVDRRLAKEMGRRRVQVRNPGGDENFQWPEDIF